MSRNRSAHAVLAVVLVTAAAACSKPPTAAISVAQQAENAAMTAGAQEYAPETASAVTAARAALDAELAAQNERWALRRSYTRATELAQAYQKAAEDATSAANTAKDQARDEATQLIAAGHALVDEVNGMLVAAPVGKGSRADLAALRTDLDAAAKGLADAEASVTAQRYLEARAQATAAGEAIQRVKAAIEQARALRRVS